MPTIAERFTGASVKRSEDPRILTGTGHYVDDVRLPGMLHAAFVRSRLLTPGSQMSTPPKPGMLPG